MSTFALTARPLRAGPGFGAVAEIATTLLNVGMTFTQLYFQRRAQTDAATQAKHERAREAATQAELASLEAQRMKALQEAAQVQAAATVSQGAGGGPVTLSAPGSAFGLPGGSTGLILGVVVVAGVGFMLMMGRAGR